MEKNGVMQRALFGVSADEKLYYVELQSNAWISITTKILTEDEFVRLF
jgi:hypothetical protein